MPDVFEKTVQMNKSNYKKGKIRPQDVMGP